MTFFGKMKAYYVNLAYLKLESGLNMRVTILDRSRRQRVKIDKASFLALLNRGCTGFQVEYISCYLL